MFCLTIAGSGLAACSISSGDASKARASSFIEADRAGTGSNELGGGGIGAPFASPKRSNVIVTWAFVGTPLRIELH